MPKQPDRIFKVAIIGGGFAGVYCAHELLRLTQEVSGMTVGIIASENHMSSSRCCQKSRAVRCRRSMWSIPSA